MALKYPDMVKTVIGAADLSLRADIGESILVKSIYVRSVSDIYATLRIEKTTVGFFRVAPTFGNHLVFPRRFTDDGATVVSSIDRNLLESLFEKGIFKGYPVGEGETLVITGVSGANDIKAVVYDIYDPGDKKPEDPNGSKSKEYFFINYGDTGAVIDTAGDYLYKRSRNPVEFPAFPYAVDVPAKTTITLHGICGKEVGVRNATPATAIYSRYLKMVREREVLFDKDRNGFLMDYSNVSGAIATRVAGGTSQIGDQSSIDPRPFLLFTEPLNFEAGEELNIYMTTVEPVDGSSIAVDYQVIGLIETVVRE
jgi:hypothetical protein